MLLAFLMILPSMVRAQSGPPAVAPQQAPGEDNAAFDIFEFQVEGNSLLPAIEIEKAVYRYLGEKRSIKDAESARESLERAYRDAGYLTVVVDIPEQRVEQGIVRLAVVEGRVDRVRVSGNRYYSRGEIRARAPSLAPGEVPYFPAVQQELAQLNRSADLAVTPVLRPGSGPGTVEFDLKTDDKLPLHGSLELNNRYSPNTTHTRLAGMLRYDNLWQRGHSLTLNAVVAPERTKDSQVFSASYLLPVGSNYAAFYYVNSKSDVAAVGSTDVIGAGQIYGARAIVPLRPRLGWQHSVTFGLDYKDFDEAVRLQGADAQETPIAYSVLMTQYAATVPGEAGITKFNAGLAFGLRDTLGNTDGEFASKRFGARPNFMIFRGDLDRTQKVGEHWQLYGKLDTQLTGDALISNEQYFAGGVDTVRGYLEAEVLGDYGVRGRAEVRRVGLGDWVPDWVRESVAYGFLDAAGLRLRDALPGQQAHFNLASAGVGLRLRAARFMRMDLDVAYPFRATTYTNVGEVRLSFRLAAEF